MDKNFRLKELLTEQYNFLKKSCEEYDRGDKSEAKRIAVSLRVFVHNTKFSKSLISQLELMEQKEVKILSWNIGFTPGAKFYVGARIGFEIRNGKSTASYVPMMDLDHPGLREISINDWWNQGILLIDRIPFTRKDVMLSLVNKEGGAHVDLIQDENFRLLTEGYLIHLQNDKGKVVKDIDLVFARENGFFMMKCIENNFGYLLN